MTTTKKDSAKISKHKAAPAQRKVTSPQAFDIMPRSKVRPDATSRPIITATKPAVADNTMTGPSTAPQLRPVAKTEGVSVADLIAKRSVKAKQTEDDHGEDHNAEDRKEDDGGYFLPVEKRKTVAPAEDAAPAAADEPKPPVKIDEPAEAVVPEAGAATEADGPMTDEKPADDVKNDGDEPSTEESAPTTPEKTLDDVLKDDAEPAQPQPQTQAFKNALQDMKDEEASLGDDGRAHRELYGGKPVIVIHKHHGVHSALSWILWFMVCLILSLVIVNFLLDAEVISTNYNVPHTNLL